MVQVIIGDITKFAVGAIVNAANSSLMSGSGVDGAIHRVGVPAVLRSVERLLQNLGCLDWRSSNNHRWRFTCKLIIHMVGPVWNGGNSIENELLANY